MIRQGSSECCTKARSSIVVNRLTIIASQNDRSEVILVMPVNGNAFQKEDNSVIKSVSSILNRLAISLCPKSPSARGLVACLPVRLLFKSTKHNAFYPV